MITSSILGATFMVGMTLFVLWTLFDTINEIKIDKTNDRKEAE